MSYIVILSLSFISVGIWDFALMAKCLQKKNKIGNRLGLACMGAGLTTASYLLAVISKNYFLYSLFSSGYFASVSFTLYALALFLESYTEQTDGKVVRLMNRLFLIWLVADIAVLAVNPFKEIAISYVYRDTLIAKYSYKMGLLCQCHLIYAYCMVVFVLYLLIKKSLAVPAMYRRQYHYPIVAILPVVVLNAVYLFVPGMAGYDYLDYSLLGYSIAAMTMYRNCFSQINHGMTDLYRNWIFENVGQGIVLFDYSGKLLVKNEKAESMLPEVYFRENMTAEEFLSQCGIQDKIRCGDRHSFQFYRKIDNVLMPTRCDYSAMVNEKNECMGHLLVFTDISMEMDILTGFHSWDNFKASADNTEQDISAAVVACDLNNLTEINRTFGRDVGDRVLQLQARVMREEFVDDAYFIRGREAILVAICYQKDEAYAREKLENVQKRMLAEKSFDCQLQLQGAVGICKGKSDIVETIQGTMDAVRAKKLLDGSSYHSDFLNSLLRALQECDKDTEAHVKRTQKTAEELAIRIGLSDAERNNLALLAVLHDIGKVGIPLELLNKPGKLTDEEWAVIRSHVQKGYQIAKSSQELSGIADMILHHHERWDGKGYPDGLVGEQIPMLSRVISVIDSYDAMINDRAYRKGLPEKQAREELIRGSGTQFDPDIVAAFLQLLEEKDSIREDTADAVEESSAEILEEAVNEEPQPIQNATVSVHRMSYTRYILEGDSKIIHVDDNFEKLTGYTKEDVANGMSQIDLIFPAERAEYLVEIRKQLVNGGFAYCEHRIRTKNGKAKHVFCFGRTYFDSAARSERTEIITTDSAHTYAVRVLVGEKHKRTTQKSGQWDTRLQKEPLTGLMTYSAFKNIAGGYNANGETRAMMLVMDIDHFSKYTETYGKTAGDRLIGEVSHALRKSLHENDLACRMENDRFAIMLLYNKGVSDEKMVRRAHQLCDRINMMMTADGRSEYTLSMGGAFLNEKVRNYQQLCDAAVQALRRAKEDGCARFAL